MKTRDQRRKRRPLGSVFVGQAVQKQSLAGPASRLLPTIVVRFTKKGCQMGSKYTCQRWQKKCQNTAKRSLKIAWNASKWHQFFAKRIDFLTFGPKSVIVKGWNMG